MKKDSAFKLKSGKVRRVSVKSNRGNFGRGTKLEK